MVRSEEKPRSESSLIGDGVATAVSALIVDPADTTYGEFTGVIHMTFRIASIVSVIRNAAFDCNCFLILG